MDDLLNVFMNDDARKYSREELEQFRQIAETGITRCERELTEHRARIVTNRLTGNTTVFYEYYIIALKNYIDGYQKVLDKIGGLNGRAGTFE